MRFMAMALAVMLAAGAAQAASLETYSKLPSMHSVLVSPDGNKVAFVQRVNGKDAVVIDQLNPAALIGNIPPGPAFNGLLWVDSNHLLAYGARGVLVVDLEKRKTTPLTDRSQTELSQIGSAIVRTRAGRTVVSVSGLKWIEQTYEPILVNVDLETGRETRESLISSKKRAEWFIDSEGAPISQEVYDEQSQMWTLQLRRGSDWAEVYSVQAPLDPPRVVGMTRDGKALVLQTITDDHGLEFRSVSLSDGKLGDLVPEYVGIRGVVYDPQTHLPIGGFKEGIEPDYVFFDPKDQALWDGIVKMFPDEEITLESWSKDRAKVAVMVTGLKHGVSHQLVDTVTHRAMGIGPVYDGLTPKDFSDVQIATYPAKDGLAIQALLTLPVGREAKNLPLIVMPHDQTNGSEQVTYHPWAQAFASRGYAVLQPQVRGSSGLGWKLEFAGIGEFGRKMQTDMSDGVRALAAQGVVDPKRVCIVGGPGYGGYAALAGVMFEQSVYRCAVAIDPWTKIRNVAGGRDADTKHSIAVRSWERFVGAKDPGDPIFDKISPAKHAADASAPILIIHARTGTDESIDDSIALVNSLHGANKSAELIPLDSVDPAALDKRRVEQLQAMVTFVEKNNPAN